MNAVRPIRPALRFARESDVIVIGSGMAGLVAALQLAPRRVTLLTKTAGLEGGSTAWAQGGIAAAVGADDSPHDHAADTVAAGAGLNDLAAVDLLTDLGARRLREWVAQGAPFDRDSTGAVLLGREAAHGRRRIVHAGGDATGRYIHRWLAEAVAQAPSIDVQASAFAWDLVVADGRVCGVLAYHDEGGWTLHRAPSVVLATGGSGQLFQYTTNPPEATADGIAMAARAGARLADLEFVQFHPTALVDPGAAAGAPMPLLTEALRGEGAILIDGKGRRFMPGEHAGGELAPRDVVARAIWRRLTAGDEVFLDMRAVMAGEGAARFPTVQALCAAAGFDPAREPVPVAPAAHYHMGGVATDHHGRTSLDGLWACGETAATGVHGANRLASNSLLEGLVFGYRVAEDIAARAPRPSAAPDVALPETANLAAAAEATARLRALMYTHVGLRRDAAGLRQALDALAAQAPQLASAGTGGDRRGSHFDAVRRWAELQNMTLAAQLVTLAALRRHESRGAHYRTDFPPPSRAAGARQFLTIDDVARPAAVEEDRRHGAATAALSA